MVTVVEAVEQDLAGMVGAPESLKAAAVALARELDREGNSATSKSMCARALLETMNRLRELAPPAVDADRIDELAEKRTRRRAKAAAG